MSQIEVGEMLYEYTLNITGLTEYGTSLAEILSGKATVPPEGARFDVRFEGRSSGGKVDGTVTGVDYLRVRADGRMDMDIHAEITTDGGQKVSLKADGVCNPRAGSSITDLKENVTLFSSYQGFTWLNTLQVWGIGTVDMATSVIHVKAYAA